MTARAPAEQTSTTSAPRVAVIQFPGVNCEYETVRALRAVGLHAEILPWNASRHAVLHADALVVPGGFSFEDRLRAGAIAAREPIVEVIAERAESGVPVLGLCNGAQILVEAGLVPARAPGRVEMGLAANNDARGGSSFLSRWVEVRVRATPRSATWTSAWADGDIVQWPIAHAEGRFTTADPAVRDALQAGGLIPFAYTDDPPPNGALFGAAGVVNARGNVLALMPHPERAMWLWQVAWDAPDPWGAARRALPRARFAAHRGDGDALAAPGPGRGLFLSLARALGVTAFDGVR
jgi:phosphoribosylformylglycinamidine synthase